MIKTKTIVMQKNYQCPICPESFTYKSDKELTWNIKAHELGKRHKLYVDLKNKHVDTLKQQFSRSNLNYMYKSGQVYISVDLNQLKILYESLRLDFSSGIFENGISCLVMC